MVSLNTGEVMRIFVRYRSPGPAAVAALPQGVRTMISGQKDHQITAFTGQHECDNNEAFDH